MKPRLLFLCILAVILVMVSATASEPKYTRDNIGDVLQMIGSDAEGINIDDLVTELNERSIEAEQYALTTSLESTDQVVHSELRKSAYYTAIARCLNWGPKHVIDWSCHDCKNTPKLTDVVTGVGQPADLAWFIGYSADDNEIVITARSSTSIQNWLYDLDFKHIPFQGCKDCYVHNGFYKAYLEVRDQYLESIAVLSTKYPTAKLRIQGHSLAAAISQHTFLDFATGKFTKIQVDGKVYWYAQNTPSYNSISQDQFDRLISTAGAIIHVKDQKWQLNQQLYNFGSPRVGNSNWSTHFQDSIGGSNIMTRSTHLNDPVVRLPPRDLIWKYQHAGNEIYWYSDSKYKNCNDAQDEDKSCALSNILPVIITDHLTYNGIVLACLLNQDQ